jgi:hypothetical protein
VLRARPAIADRSDARRAELRGHVRFADLRFAN